MDFVLQGRSGKKCEVREPVTIMTDIVLEENPVTDYVGIDVGAKSVVVSVRRAGRLIGTDTFPQTPEGHRTLIKRHSGSLACGVIEATGCLLSGLGDDFAPGRMAGGSHQSAELPSFRQAQADTRKTDMSDAALPAE
ncbi:hypothetical protein AGMMS50256_12210 [Betaproteobacteria bacterium]|nr:hypothetical protein AGMMS50256_12210 [Betaproteobacteria bacterium]